MERDTLQQGVEMIEITIKISTKNHFQLAKLLHLGSENPALIVEKTPHSQRVTVSCNLWFGGVTRPYFFESK